MTLETNEALTALAERANKTPEEFAEMFCDAMLSYSRKYRDLRLNLGFSKTIKQLNAEVSAVAATLKHSGIECVTLEDMKQSETLTIINTEEEEKRLLRQEEAAHEKWVGY